MRLGSDPDQLERTAADCADAASRLGRLRSLAVDMRSVRWVGHDREAVVWRVERDVLPTAELIAARLSGMAERLRSQAAAQRRVSTPDGAPPRSLLGIDPFGDGGAIVAVGDVTTATHVAILVPGMGSTLATFDQLVDHAAHLQALATSMVGATDGVAVVAWLDYDAPGGLEDPGDILSVLSTHDAEVGAAALRSFIQRLDLRDDVVLTLVGHSYGTLVATDAAVCNDAVDRLLVLASPGVGADDVAELGLAETTKLYAGAAATDLVAASGYFGRPPTDPRFGAIVIDASEGKGRREPRFPGSHSSYFDPGSTSLDNIAHVITDGRPSRPRGTRP